MNNGLVALFPCSYDSKHIYFFWKTFCCCWIFLSYFGLHLGKGENKEPTNKASATAETSLFLYKNETYIEIEWKRKDEKTLFLRDVLIERRCSPDPFAMFVMFVYYFISCCCCCCLTWRPKSFTIYANVTKGQKRPAFSFEADGALMSLSFTYTHTQTQRNK